MYNKCPECNNAAIPLLKKYSIKNNDVFSCEACGAQLGYPKWTRRFVLVSYLIIFFIYNFYIAPLPYSGFIRFALLVAIGFAVTAISYLFFPFEKKEI